jgi:hypothetical protein
MFAFLEFVVGSVALGQVFFIFDHLGLPVQIIVPLMLRTHFSSQYNRLT